MLHDDNLRPLKDSLHDDLEKSFTEYPLKEEDESLEEEGCCTEYKNDERKKEEER